MVSFEPHYIADIGRNWYLLFSDEEIEAQIDEINLPKVTQTYYTWQNQVQQPKFSMSYSVPVCATGLCFDSVVDEVFSVIFNSVY